MLVNVTVQDNFTTGASQNLTSRTNWSAQTPSGFVTMATDSVPTTATGTAANSGNIWAPPSGGAIGQFGPDQCVFVTMAAFGSGVIQLLNRLIDTTDYYICQVTQSTSAWVIGKNIASTPTTLASGATQAVSAGDSVAFACVGYALEAYYQAVGTATWSQILKVNDTSILNSRTFLGYTQTVQATAISAFGGGPVEQAGVNPGLTYGHRQAMVANA